MGSGRKQLVSHAQTRDSALGLFLHIDINGLAT